MPYFEGYDPFVNEWGLSTNKPINLGSLTNPSPKQGDLWFDGSNLNFRLGGVSYQLNLGYSINFNETFFLMGA